MKLDARQQTQARLSMAYLKGLVGSLLSESEYEANDIAFALPEYKGPLDTRDKAIKYLIRVLEAALPRLREACK